MKKFILPIVLSVIISACSDSEKLEQSRLTNKEKAKIESLSNELINSINSFDFSVVNKNWNNEAFKTRVSINITKVQKSVLDHVFEKDLKHTILVGNLSIIHKMNSDDGKVFFLALNHYDFHSELILLLTFDGRFNFVKYRIQLINNNPSLTDFYHYKDNLWFSEKITNTLKLNSKFGAYSKERTEANRAMESYEKALSYGDTRGALNALYSIPNTHQTGRIKYDET